MFPRPTSWTMEGYRRVIERRADRFARSGLNVRSGEHRDWSRRAGTLDDNPRDNYPIYYDITDLPLPGTAGGIGGVMMNG